LYDPNGAFAWYNVISDPWSFKDPGPDVWHPSGNSKREVEAEVEKDEVEVEAGKSEVEVEFDKREPEPEAAAAAFNASTSSRIKRHNRRSHDLKH
jgi:hypothetical protein